MHYFFKLTTIFTLFGFLLRQVDAGPASYAVCQSLAALGCGPAGYAVCQASAATACLATGPGWFTCYAGCQAICAGLGGTSWAVCYASAQVACAATFVAPTP
jgi:hypothetical protein